MRSWFYDSNGNWVPTIDLNGQYHPDWLEQFFEESELKQFREALAMFPESDRPTWKEYLNFKYNYYYNAPVYIMPD